MIIGLIGKKQSGKDTVFQIAEQLGPVHVARMAFGDALKAEVARCLRVTVEEINTHKALYRPMLQWYGTEFRRRLDGEDYWINKLAPFQPGMLNIVTDVRFPNEAGHIRFHGGILVRVVRPDGPQDSHASETLLEEITPDYTLHNNGRPEDLRVRVSELLATILKRFLADVEAAR
tara:strand:- start:67 stop:591 length:525 start_codon:yes stop_codon:yes gene_type:complete